MSTRGSQDAWLQKNAAGGVQAETSTSEDRRSLEILYRGFAALSWLLLLFGMAIGLQPRGDEPPTRNLKALSAPLLSHEVAFCGKEGKTQSRKTLLHGMECTTLQLQIFKG